MQVTKEILGFFLRNKLDLNKIKVYLNCLLIRRKGYILTVEVAK